MKSLSTSSSPHILAPFKTNHIMLDVIIALMPALVASVLLFGWRALALVLITTASCVVAEFLFNLILKKKQTVGDLSAIVTGLILAFNFPVHFSFGFAILGGFIAIIIVKMIFGGIGFNLVNPAIAARAVMVVVFSLPLTGMLDPLIELGELNFDVVSVATPNAVFEEEADAVTGATPLTIMAHGDVEDLPTYTQMFLGIRGGALGETSKLALLLGGLYLIIRRVISPIIPITFIATVFVMTGLLGENSLVHILSGGLFLGAFFMATDYTTSPMTRNGRVLFGVGLGLITTIIRVFGAFSEGIAFALVVMNLLVPHLENFTMPRVFGSKEGVKDGA